MLYKDLRKVLKQTAKIELSIFDKNPRTKIYFVKNTRQFDNYKVDFVASQKAIINNEPMLVADLVMNKEEN